MDRPIFLPTVPDRNPRTECGCQPVAFISSLSVAPSGRFSSSSTLAVLLPSRLVAGFSAFWRPLGAFLGGVAFLRDLPVLGATCARRAPTRAFLVAFGFSSDAVAWVVSFSSVVVIYAPVAVMTASPHGSLRWAAEARQFCGGEGSAMAADSGNKFESPRRMTE